MIDFSDNSKSVLKAAGELAVRTGGLICTEHLVYGLLCVQGSTSQKLLSACGLSADALLSYFPLKQPHPNVQMSARAGRAVEDAREVARDLGARSVGTEHMLYALLDDGNSVAADIVRAAGVNPEKLQRETYNAITRTGGFQSAAGSVSVDGMLDDYMRSVFGEENYHSDSSRTANAGYGMSDPAPSVQRVKSDERGKKEEKPAFNLTEFGIDLTQKARSGKLDPVIGRGKETERVIQVLCRRTKNNPILIGEPGVGKSAVIDGLAQAIAAGSVPNALKDKIVFSLDLTSLVAGTRYRGDFEERLKTALSNIRTQGNIVLFIDEIHTMLKAGSSEGGLDIANVLKPMLARGELQTIGATTLEEYRKYFEQDAALERRFQPILVEQPSVSDTIEILQGLKPRYEAHHGVEITDEAVFAAAVLSDRYVTDRFLPDKAIDLIDEAASKKKIFHFTTPQNIRELENKIKDTEIKLAEAKRKENYDKCAQYKALRDNLVEQKEKADIEWRDKCAATTLSIGEEEIADVVGSWTGIPVRRITEDESEKLGRLESVLESRVIGQAEACGAVARAVKRARAGLKDPKRPIGSFVFTGATGVGKTELAKALAEALFGDENLLIRVDMSEYMERENLSKLIGSAPGYVGFEEGGQLTEKVRRKPYSVVLFDEIEKAHPEIFNILLQILEDGRLTDSRGRTVSFKNTVIILTSNLGADAPAHKAALGFSGADSATADAEDERMRHINALKKAMKPEIINRIDEIVVFRKLSKQSVRKIADIMLASLDKRLGERGINVVYTDAAKDYIVTSGYDAEYGARPLRRTIQRLVEDKLSEMLLTSQVADGGRITVDSDGNQLCFRK